MVSNLITNSFSINLKVMRILGFYPPDEYKMLYKAYAVFLYIVLLIPIPIFGFLNMFLEDEIDLVEVSHSMFIIVDMTCFIAKLVPFIQDGHRIKKCIHYFDSLNLYPFRNSQEKVLEECVRICIRNAKVFLGGIVISLCCWGFRPFFLKPYTLPLDVWLPFEYTGSLMRYASTYVYLVLGVGYSAFSSVGIDPLIGGLAYHASGQLRVLKNNLQYLEQYAEEEIVDKKDKFAKSQKIYEKIKLCIKHHRAILSFYKEFQECFSLPVFSQFVGSTVVFGFCCLRLNQLPLLNINFGIMVVYFVTAMGQIYFYCYYGTTLVEESDSLNTAIYMSTWYKYDTRSKKALLLLMENSKNPMIVMAGKVFDLSLVTFTGILKKSYSVLAVLKNY